MESTNYINFEKFPYLIGYLHADHSSKAIGKVLSAAVCDPNSRYERAVIMIEDRTACGAFYRVVVENARTMYDYEFDTEEEAYARCERMGVNEPSSYVLGWGFNDGQMTTLPNDPCYDTTAYEHLFA